MSLRPYYSLSLGETWVVDHIRISDKPIKKHAPYTPNGDTMRREYTMPTDKKRLVRKQEVWK